MKPSYYKVITTITSAPRTRNMPVCILSSPRPKLSSKLQELCKKATNEEVLPVSLAPSLEGFAVNPAMRIEAEVSLQKG